MAQSAADTIDYAGQELQTFALATNWKTYVRGKLAPYIVGEVAEVGAGLGETTKALIASPQARTWTCIEPDTAMAEQIRGIDAAGGFVRPVEVYAGILGSLPAGRQFDTVIYIDVLEHIEDDSAELEAALTRLRPGGRIVVLSPAFQSLYSEFDRAIGHFRRYTAAQLRVLSPAGSRVTASFYLDSVGMMASAANKLLLRQKMPGRGQVLTWDRLMVPLSRIVDPLIGRSFGRSVVVVWTKAETA
jgi:2-polyprenyl-3-methyl-5-hydroxy-6-metoxy-1,4-benzoquinol methylase